jgi:hypothetical protein
MSGYYSIKTKNLFDPKSKGLFTLSRSKIDLFMECPRCFYLDRRIGIGRPPGFPFNLNSAVDELLKKEFDINRANGNPHPLMKEYGIDAVPFSHEKLDEWRHTFTGVRCNHEKTNFCIFGGIDDVWVNPKGELHVVDYKATSKNEEVTLDAAWQDGYKRQVEVYQWLFRQNGFKVSNIAYFVYANGKRDREAFDGRLEFDVKVIPYEGSDSWIEGTLLKMRECLMSPECPECSEGCDWCVYTDALDKYHATARVKESPSSLFDTL